MKVLIGTPVNFLIQNFSPYLWSVARTDNKRQQLVYHNFPEVVVNNAGTSSPYDAVVIACFWCCYNNIFSIINPLDFSKDNVSIPVSTLNTCVLFIIFLSMWKPKRKPIPNILLKISYYLKLIIFTYSWRFFQ